MLDPEVFRTMAMRVCTANNWTLEGSAGQGQYKATFEVLREDDCKIALKVYRPDVNKERTEREIETLKRVQHKNLPSFISYCSVVCEGEAIEYSTEEFLDGGSLTDLLDNSLLPLGRVHNIGEQLLDALKHIAELELVHRDIKPDNIMFRSDKVTPVLVDFGFVRDLAQVSLTASWQPQGPGTPFFAPPEQLTNDKDSINWRSDQFSLGVVLSFCGYGKHPYQQEGDSPNEVVQRVISHEQPSVDFKIWAESVGLGTLIKMIQPWPVERFCRIADLLTSWSAQQPKGE